MVATIDSDAFVNIIGSSVGCLPKFTTVNYVPQITGEFYPECTGSDQTDTVHAYEEE